jgi:hypothetical protein
LSANWRPDILEKTKDDNIVLLSKRAVANRRNAQLSTGPRTKEGKSRSRRNALKHGVLASALLLTEGVGAEDQAEFDELSDALHISYRDLAPVGTLEELLVEKIAVCWWRQKRAIQCETGLVGQTFAPPGGTPIFELYCKLGGKWDPELKTAKEQLRLPLDDNRDRILRYEITIQRELAYAINLLERLQRGTQRRPPTRTCQRSGFERSMTLIQPV